MAAVIPQKIARACVRSARQVEPEASLRRYLSQYDAVTVTWSESNCKTSVQATCTFIWSSGRNTAAMCVGAHDRGSQGNICQGMPRFRRRTESSAAARTIRCYPPKVTVARLVNSLKGVSSRLLGDRRPEIPGCYKDGVLWSPFYFAGSCGGAPLSIIAQCVRNQRNATPPLT
jgi:hypothetical protein